LTQTVEEQLTGVTYLLFVLPTRIQSLW